MRLIWLDWRREWRAMEHGERIGTAVLLVMPALGLAMLGLGFLLGRCGAC